MGGATLLACRPWHRLWGLSSEWVLSSPLISLSSPLPLHTSYVSADGGPQACRCRVGNHLLLGTEGYKAAVCLEFRKLHVHLPGLGAEVGDLHRSLEPSRRTCLRTSASRDPNVGDQSGHCHGPGRIRSKEEEPRETALPLGKRARWVCAWWRQPSGSRSLLDVIPGTRRAASLNPSVMTNIQ